MSKTTLPGIKAKHFIISDNCCKINGEDGAIDYSLQQIREEFIRLRKAWKGKEAKIHVAITIERKE